MGKWFRRLAVVGAAAAMAGAMAAPVGAGIFDEENLPTLTVEKQVVTTEDSYDVTGLFTVLVSCVDTKDGEDDFDATLTFNPDGSPHSAPGGWVDTGSAWSFQDWDLLRATCTVTEEAGGAATNLAPGSPTYTCVFTNTLVEEVIEEGALEESEEDPGCLSTDGTDPAMVHFGHPWDESCVVPELPVSAEGKDLCKQTGDITVTNVIATDPAKVAADAVVITPRFTG